jgi:hypothetical protein
MENWIGKCFCDSSQICYRRSILFLKGLGMKKTWLLTLVLAVAMPVLLSGCVVARDVTVGADEKTQEKFADRVACKVVEKLIKEGCPLTASTNSAEPNKPSK